MYFMIIGNNIATNDPRPHYPEEAGAKMFEQGPVANM